MTGFSDPILTGDGSLIRKAAKSPNYVPGSAGWTVNQDGSAEFNSVTVRGPVQVISSDGSYVYVQTSGGTAGIVLEPPSAPGYNWSPGSITTESDGLSGRADMVITSPQQQGSSGGTAQILLEGADGSSPKSLIQLGAGDIQVVGNLSVIGVGQVRYATASGGQAVTNSSTLQDDTALTMSVTAGAVYDVEIWAYFHANSAAAALLTNWSVPAGSSGLKACVGATNVAAGYTSTSQTQSRYTSRSLTTASTYQLDGSGNDQVVIERSILTAGADGNVTFRWAQNAATAGATTQRDSSSFMKITRIS